MITSHCLQDFTKKCKTSFNFTVCNCMLHPWLLYMSPHIKPVLFSDEDIMPNKYTSYTWIFIYNLMCILSCKSGRIHAHVFICMENILTQFNFHHYHYCIHFTFVHFMFACSMLFFYFGSFLFSFSLFFCTLSFQRWQWQWQWQWKNFIAM